MSNNSANNAQNNNNTGGIQLSAGTMISSRDEINAGRLTFNVDYSAYWKEIMTTDDAYQRYRNKKEIIVLNEAERTKDDPKYWSSGWAKHSQDLIDMRHNYAVANTDVDPNRIVYSSITNYNGVSLLRPETQFPLGSTPIRYIDITKAFKTNIYAQLPITQITGITGSTESGNKDLNTYSQVDAYINEGFPADQTGLNSSKQDWPEINDCPDRGPYTSEADIKADESTTSLLPNTKVNFVRPTMDFSINLDVSKPLNINEILDLEQPYSGNNRVTHYIYSEYIFITLSDPQNTDNIYNLPDKPGDLNHFPAQAEFRKKTRALEIVTITRGDWPLADIPAGEPINIPVGEIISIKLLPNALITEGKGEDWGFNGNEIINIRPEGWNLGYLNTPSAPLKIMLQNFPLFTLLGDTPDTYEASAEYGVKVNEFETGVVFKEEDEIDGGTYGP